MSWLRNLLLGTFTRHLGTKLLALLLSIGLFGFVQSSLSGTQEIRKITLRFNLAQELRHQYVLLTEEIPFEGLVIGGMRAKVDPLAKLYRGEPVVNLAIDKKFLDVYGEDHGEGKVIRIDRDLFADDRLFGRDITVDKLKDRVVVVDGIAERSARVEVDPKMPAAITDPNHEYEGRLALSFNVTFVKIEGPASAFTGEDPTILASVEGVVNRLSRYQIRGERGEAKLAPVEIAWQGIATERVPLLRIHADELGTDPVSAQEFQQRLVASCPVTKRKKQKSLPGLPIDIRYPTPRLFDLVEEWDVYPPVFVNRDLTEGKMQQLDVRLPVSLSGNKDFLSNLVVVLDVSAAKADPATPDTMLVPFYLDLKDRTREEDVAGLALVEIVPQALAEFRKKTK